MPELRSYIVDADAFFAGGMLNPPLAARCQNAMESLIRRFDLEGARVLSLGSAESFEEFWFWKAGCRLTLNDLDSTGTFERYLRSLPHPSGSALTYIVGDAAELVGSSDGRYDLVYVSSFHPDELRREGLQRRTSPGKEDFSLAIWPRGEEAYHPTLMSATRLVRDGGLAIFQHYRGGANVALDPHYLADVQWQFVAHGLSLLEVYAFAVSPRILLVVAIKGSLDDAAALSRVLSTRPAVKEFFGRHPGKWRKHAVRVFSAGSMPRSERTCLYGWRTVHKIRRALRKLVHRR